MKPVTDQAEAPGEPRAPRGAEVDAVLASSRAAIDEVVRHCAGRMQRLQAEMQELRSMLEAMGGRPSRARMAGAPRA
jgi:hypothetical protein